MAAGGKASSKVRSHPLVEALTPDPSKPPRQTLKLVGLPGPAPEAGQTRLWLDPSLTSYVDVPDEAILYSKELPDDAGTVLWVAADAQLTYGSVSSHETQASFLTGAITASHLATAANVAGAAGAAQGAVVTQTLPSSVPSACTLCPTHVSPCVSVPTNCPSVDTCTPSHLPPCVLSAPPCPSTTFFCHRTIEPPCPSWTILCHRTLEPPCPSTTFICRPTNPIICRVTLTPNCPVHTGPEVCPPSIGCPSHDVICQSGVITIICPTPSAVGGCASHLCPSVSIPCQSATVCPSGICPSAACGGQVGGGGTVAQ